MRLEQARGFLTDMTAFHEFVTQLLNEGTIVFRSATAPHDRASARGIAILAEAFETTGLSVAGPRITFDPSIACAAAELVRQASWALVCHDERVSDLEKRLKMPGLPVDVVAPPFRRPDATLLAPDPAAGSRPGSRRPAGRAAGEHSSALAALRRALGCGRSSAGSLGLWRTLGTIALVCRAFDWQRSAILAARTAGANLGLF